VFSNAVKPEKRYLKTEDLIILKVFLKSLNFAKPNPFYRLKKNCQLIKGSVELHGVVPLEWAF
jgi:hypothetical protein